MAKHATARPVAFSILGHYKRGMGDKEGDGTKPAEPDPWRKGLIAEQDTQGRRAVLQGSGTRVSYCGIHGTRPGQAEPDEVMPAVLRRRAQVGVISELASEASNCCGRPFLYAQGEALVACGCAAALLVHENDAVRRARLAPRPLLVGGFLSCLCLYFVCSFGVPADMSWVSLLGSRSVLPSYCQCYQAKVSAQGHGGHDSPSDDRAECASSTDTCLDLVMPIS